MKATLKQSAVVAIIVLGCAQGLLAQAFLFSARPEFTVASGGAVDTVSERYLEGTPIDRGVFAWGWAVESGMVGSGGGLVTVSAHGGFGGVENIGVFLNFGALIDDFGWMLSFGVHRIPYHIKVVEDNVVIDRYTDQNYLIGGLSCKMLIGKTHHVDITPKIVIGYRESHFITDDNGTLRYYYDENYSAAKSHLIAALSLGVGYTLIAGR